MPISISGDGPITGITSLNTTVDSTELGYLNGTTSAIQTQINTKISSPAYTSWTPTVQNSAGTANLTLNVDYNLAEASYYRMGNFVYCVIKIRDIRATKAGLRFTLPFTALTADYMAGSFLGSTAIGGIFLLNNTTATMGIQNGQDLSEYKYGSFSYLAVS